MKVRIAGAGAVGAVVAAQLAGTADVGFIADDEHRKRYQNGISINGKKHLFQVFAPSDADTADLLIFAVKNMQLMEVLEEARPFVGENTVIMSLLNGIDAEREIEKVFGENRTLYSFITDLSSTRQGDDITCFSGSGTIVFGEKDDSNTERVQRIARFFDEAGQKYLIPENIRHEKWWKFMLNTCFNTLSAILLADYAAISSNRDFIRLVRMIAREIQSVAIKEGVLLTQEDVEEMIRRVTSLTDHGKTSMLQDVLAHRETENRYFAGAISRLGKKHSVPTPYCDFIQIMLEAKRHVLSI